jgi:hypothetical protein
LWFDLLPPAGSLEWLGNGLVEGKGVGAEDGALEGTEKGDDNGTAESPAK